MPSPTVLPAFPDPAGYAWNPVLTGLELPVDIQNAGDGSGRLFIVEKHGRIRILKGGQVLPTPFLDISAEVGSRSTEQGLLGLAFHPHYSQSGLFYVNYTDENGNTVIARFHVSADNPDLADPASQVDILRIDQPYNNHNGGGLAFGPDGYLYIGLGDGGSEGDPLLNGQNLRTLLGKLLRIDVDHATPYAIPAGNPFAKSGGLAEIWAYGLRNPWRFSFDRLTGDLYIADVGQDAWEEIDFVPSGVPGGMNFGWSYYEGMHPYKGQPPANASFTAPVTEYSHSDGCAVTGGYVYRGAALPEWQGVYFYGDYCSGNIWGVRLSGGNAPQAKILFTTSAKITTFGVDEAWEIYLADYGLGQLLRLERK
jgi:glucose/arabinose dehydrogenase